MHAYTHADPQTRVRFEGKVVTLRRPVHPPGTPSQLHMTVCTPALIIGPKLLFNDPCATT